MERKKKFVFGFVDENGNRQTKVEAPPQAIVMSVAERYEQQLNLITQVGGHELKRALLSVLALYKRGFPYFPLDLLCVKEYVETLKFDRVTTIVDLAYVFAYVTMVDCTNNNHIVTDCLLPQRQLTLPITRDIIENASVMTNEGLSLVVGGSGENVIDYIVPKYDGVLVHFFSVTTDSLVRGFALQGMDIIEMDSGFPVFSGEMVQDRIYAFYGMDFNQNLPDTLLLKNKIYYVEQTKPMTINSFFENATENVDGYIMSVNTIEYKIKFSNTVDLEYLAGTTIQVDGLVYTIINQPDNMTPGIYEFHINEQVLTFLRRRFDKNRGQSASDIKFIESAPTVAYVRSLLSNMKFGFLCPNNEFFHVSIVAGIIRTEIMRVNADEYMITRKLVKNICSCRRIATNGDDITKIMRYLCGGHSAGTNVKKNKLLEVQCSESRYATRSSFYAWLFDSKLCLTIKDAARQFVRENVAIVSLRRIYLMALVGEITVIGNRIMARRIGKNYCNYKSRRVDRLIPIDDEVQVHRALIQYTKFNEGRKSLETELQHYETECEELIACDLDSHAMEEVGDVMMMLTKIILRVYTNGKALEDEDSYIWRLLLESKIMWSFVRKMRNRLALYGCVRNHESAKEHVCCNGIVFKPTVDLVSTLGNSVAVINEEFDKYLSSEKSAICVQANADVADVDFVRSLTRKKCFINRQYSDVKLLFESAWIEYLPKVVTKFKFPNNSVLVAFMNRHDVDFISSYGAELYNYGKMVHWKNDYKFNDENG